MCRARCYFNSLFVHTKMSILAIHRKSPRFTQLIMNKLFILLQGISHLFSLLINFEQPISVIGSERMLHNNVFALLFAFTSKLLLRNSYMYRQHMNLCIDAINLYIFIISFQNACEPYPMSLDCNLAIDEIAVKKLVLEYIASELCGSSCDKPSKF